MITRTILWLLLWVGAACAASAQTESNLQQALSDKAAKSSAPSGIRAKMQAGIDSAALLLPNVLQVGQPAPDFTLNNLKGKPQTLAQLLKKGPVVLTWYRGGWCPYCNLALQYYESQLQPALVAKGITLVALAPELPEKGLKTQQKHKLTYTLLTDLHNEVARRYGVAFRLTEDLRPLYKAWVGLENYNGDDRSELPLAATFLISPDGVIRWRWVHADYKQRATPEDILKAIAEWEPITGR